MAFTPNIPASGETLGNSRLEILNNFANYNTVVSTNHVAPNSTGAGKHKFVQMPVQSPVPSTLAGEGGLFTQTINGVSLLYYQRDANTTVNQAVLPMATCTFILRNTNGAATKTAGYNVTAVTRVGTGNYQVDLTFAIPYVAGSQEYGVLYGVQGNPLIANSAVRFYTSSITATTGTTSQQFFIQIANSNGATIDDAGNRLTFSVIQ